MGKYGFVNVIFADGIQSGDKTTTKRQKAGHGIFISEEYLWYKNQAQGGGAAEYYKYRQHNKHGILLVSQYEAYSRSSDTHDHNVVYAHSDVFTIV